MGPPQPAPHTLPVGLDRFEINQDVILDADGNIGVIECLTVDDRVARILLDTYLLGDARLQHPCSRCPKPILKRAATQTAIPEMSPPPPAFAQVMSLMAVLHIQSRRGDSNPQPPVGGQHTGFAENRYFTTGFRR